MNNADHHASPAIGSTGLGLLDRSPLHYWAAYLDPQRTPRKTTPAMEFGTAVHCAVLEPQTFDATYAILPLGTDKRTKDGKAFFAAIEAAGQLPISNEDWLEIQRMKATVSRLPIFQKILTLNPQYEQSIFWVDANGIECKCRPDIWVPPCAEYPNGLVADLKTTKDASAKAFCSSLWGYNMHLQAALYTEGAHVHHKTAEPPPFVWLAVESDVPYAAAHYTAPAELIDYGRAEVSRLKEIYKGCLDSGIWPGYPQEAQELALQGWMLKAMQDDEVSVEIRHV